MIAKAASASPIIGKAKGASLQSLEHSRELPKGWSTVKLGRVMASKLGSVDPSKFQDEIFVLYSVPAFDQREPEVLPGRKIGSAKQVVQAGDVLLSKIVPHIRRSWVVSEHSGSRIIASGEWIVFRSEIVWPDYLRHVLVSDDFHEEFMRTTSGVGGSLTRARPALVANIRIPLPPLPEQKRIAAILNEQMAAVERARKAAEERLAAVNALAPAHYRRCFDDAPTLRASPLVPPAAPRPGWTWYRLTDIARLATGHTPSRYHAEYWKGDIPWIQLADIRSLDGREAHATSEYTNALGIQNSAAVLLPKGTVCLSRTASVGFVTTIGRAMATSQDFVNWVCDETLDARFLLHLFIANRRSIIDLGSGAVHHTIYFPTVESFCICAPPLAEQRRIAAMLNEQMAAVGQARDAAKGELATINTLPAALLRRAFNGEL